MKKLLLFVIIFAFAFSCMQIFANSEISLYINGTRLSCDVAPQIVNDRTLCPTRAIFDAFGASVEWNDAKKQVLIKKDGSEILLTVGSETAYVNEQKVTLDCAPTIISDRCMVPIRFISETLGCAVNWRKKQKACILYMKKKITNSCLFRI